MIANQEAAGQRQLVNSDRLPVRGSENTEFLTLGFTFGEVDRNDSLFRPATLPPGWKREGSDHSMWSFIVDELGRKRVSIFYKAAFYDRDAFMYLENPISYLRSAIYEDTKVVMDDKWLTPAVVQESLETMAKHEDKAAADSAELGARRNDSDGYWAESAAKHRAKAAKYRSFSASLVK